MVTIAQAFRDFVVDGVPGSGPWSVQKSDVRAALAGVPTGTSIYANASYAVQPQDAGATISSTAGIGSIIYGAASSYQSTHFNWVNNQTNRRWTISTPNGSVFLYPGQWTLVHNENNIWVIPQQQRWRILNPFLYADSLLGNDGNDGLAAGSGAKATLTGAFTEAVDFYDTVASYLNIVPNGTFSELLTVASQLTYLPAIFLGGASPGAFTWQPANGACMTFGDISLLQLLNTVFDGSLSTNNTALNFHQHGVMDMLAGVTFGNFPGATSIHMTFDHLAPTLNVDQPYTVSGGASRHTSMGTGATIEYGLVAPIVFSGAANSITIGTWHSLAGSGSSIVYATAQSYSNLAALAAGCQQFSADFLSSIQLAGTTLPGSVSGATAHGAQVA